MSETGPGVARHEEGSDDGPPAAAHALLRQLVDYAGLFPPASLPLSHVVAKYGAYRRGRYAWMLGRLIVPATQLGLLTSSGRVQLPGGEHALPWRVSALVGPDLARDVGEIRAFNDRHGAGSAIGRAVVDAIELKVTAPREIVEAARALPAGVRAAFEWPLDQDPAPYLENVAAVRGIAKARLGGVTPPAVPGADAVAGWLSAAARLNVPVKATAGLHHAIRGERALTYDEASPRAVMHGFLNVFVAASYARTAAASLSERDLRQQLVSMLDDSDPRAFAADSGAVRWRDVSLTVEQVSNARGEFALSFGSCSFEEPVEEVRAMGWVP